VKIVQVDDNTLSAVGEYHIWNSAYAFSYPALNTDPSGNIGVSVAYAGPSDYPSSTVGYIGDFVVYYVEASTVSLKFYVYASGPNAGLFTFTNPGDGSLQSDSSGNPIVFTRYGDYFSVRNSGSDGTLFSNQGYAVSLIDSSKSTTCLQTPGCTYHPHYEQWGSTRSAGSVGLGAEGGLTSPAVFGVAVYFARRECQRARNVCKDAFTAQAARRAVS
jgi:hypothetical protein